MTIWDEEAKWMNRIEKRNKIIKELHDAVNSALNDLINSSSFVSQETALKMVNSKKRAEKFIRSTEE